MDLPHPGVVTIREYCDYIKVLLYSYYCCRAVSLSAAACRCRALKFIAGPEPRERLVCVYVGIDWVCLWLTGVVETHVLFVVTLNSCITL